jgi:hypothetical protein
MILVPSLDLTVATNCNTCVEGREANGACL